jgi:cell division protein FtsI (penicillin-binding protein 3)
MAFGYGVSTPMQTLAFYNAVANNGVMVKPHLFQKLKREQNHCKKWKRKYQPKICSTETLLKLKAVLKCSKR